MTIKEQKTRDTAEAMHDTAEALERSEAILHETAEKSPDQATTTRLHALGDEVTRQAKDIDRRADSIGPGVATGQQPGSVSNSRRD